MQELKFNVQYFLNDEASICDHTKVFYNLLKSTNQLMKNNETYKFYQTISAKRVLKNFT